MAREGQGYPCYQRDMMMMIIKKIYIEWKVVNTAKNNRTRLHFHLVFLHCDRKPTKSGDIQVIYNFPTRENLTQGLFIVGILGKGEVKQEYFRWLFSGLSGIQAGWSMLHGRLETERPPLRLGHFRVGIIDTFVTLA